MQIPIINKVTEIPIIKHNVQEITPDKDLTICIALVGGKNITGHASNLYVKDKDTTKKIPLVFVSGSLEMVRAHIHAMIDGIFDIHEEQQQRTKGKDDKSFIWNP